MSRKLYVTNWKRYKIQAYTYMLSLVDAFQVCYYENQWKKRDSPFDLWTKILFRFSTFKSCYI